MRLLVLLLAGCEPSDPGTRAYPTPSAHDDTGTPIEESDDGGADGGGDGGAVEVEDDAIVVSASFPTGMDCGSEAAAWVTVQNTGSATWTWEGGYKLGAVDDQDDLLQGDVRVWLEEDEVVGPGQQHAFAIPLDAPPSAQVVTTDWQMVHEGVTWFGETAAAAVEIACEEDPGEEQLPLPDRASVVRQVADEHPDLFARSCQDDTDGSWEFLDLVVDTLRVEDDRWGYNWKRGVVGDPSKDVIDYHWGTGDHEGSIEVYIIDVIASHCSESASPAWTDVTQSTADGGTIGMWTGRGRF